MKKKLLSLDAVHELHQAGRLDEAREGYLRLLEVNPNNVSALHYLGVLYAEMNDLEAAQQYLEAAVKLEPKNVSLLLHLANILRARGFFSEAINLLQSTIKLSPQFAALYNNLGIAYFSQEKWLDAVRAYQQAIDVQPDYVDAYYNLGLALTKAKHFQESASAYQALLELAPEHLGGRFQWGCLLMLQNRYQDALEQFSRIENKYPTHFETQSNLATCCLRIGMLSRAKFHYMKALEVMPKDLQILYNLGVICMQQGRISEAVDFYQRALDAEPNSYEAHNNIAVAYLAMQKRQQALQHFQAALQLQPANEAVRHTINILSKEKPVSASPPDYIRSLFDSYADHYDAHVVNILNYQLPRHMYQLAADNFALTPKTWDVLDLGCGTGLCGEMFKTAARSLTGVDLSEKMLAEAKQKYIYDRLVQADVLTFLTDQHNAFNLVLAGDVLVYIGELEAVFSVVYGALRPEGFFIFNCEMSQAQAKGFEIQTSGRFAHSKEYVDMLVKKAGFEIVDYQVAPIRSQDASLVEGHLYLLMRR